MRTLYVARHGEALGDLTAAGRRQAALLGSRSAAVPLTGVFHSPVARAAQTASIVASCLADVPVAPTELLDDYPPTDEPVPGCSAEARAAGPALGARALAEFGTLDDRRGEHGILNGASPTLVSGESHVQPTRLPRGAWELAVREPGRRS